MRWKNLFILLWIATATAVQAESTKIIKVLPQFLDQQGRHVLSPSLYERDAYQAELRKKPELRSGLRFAIQWKGRAKTDLKLRVEARGGHADGKPTAATIEEPVRRRALFSKWSSLVLAGERYRQFGELVAWRVTLWEGDKLVAEKKSFLW